MTAILMKIKKGSYEYVVEVARRSRCRPSQTSLDSICDWQTRTKDAELCSNCIHEVAVFYTRRHAIIITLYHN
jgi:hypothetical protein